MCGVEGCNRLQLARGWCRAHYERWLYRGDVLADVPLKKGSHVLTPLCIVNDCDKPRNGKKWCQMHYRRWSLYGDVLADIPAKGPRGECSVPGCGRPHDAHGWCHTHRCRWEKYGDPLGDVPIKTIGAGSTDKNGYRIIYVDGKPRAEHRVVMETILGRDLLPGENVHHKNGQRADNNPENLELWVQCQPVGQRMEDLLAWAWQIIELYEDVRLPLGENHEDASACRIR